MCVNSHINFLVLFQSSTCLSFMFAPSVRMDSSPTLTQLLFLVSYISLWKLRLVFLWLALMFRSSAGSLVFRVTWLVLKYSLLDVRPQDCTQFMRCNCLRSYSAAAGTLVFPYNFGDRCLFGTSSVIFNELPFRQMLGLYMIFYKMFWSFILFMLCQTMLFFLWY